MCATDRMPVRDFFTSSRENNNQCNTFLLCLSFESLSLPMVSANNTAFLRVPHKHKQTTVLYTGIWVSLSKDSSAPRPVLSPSPPHLGPSMTTTNILSQDSLSLLNHRLQKLTGSRMQESFVQRGDGLWQCELISQYFVFPSMTVV